MAYLITQGGSTLYKMDLTTGTATALTLPTGVTLDPLKKPHFAVLNQWVVMVNSPTRNLAIDPEGTVRVLVPLPPDHAPYAVAGSGTGLTGAYQVQVSYVVLSTDGELLMESPLSPPSIAVTLANNDLSLSKIPISTDVITARRIYRTLSGGTVYYQLLDLMGNINTVVLNNTSDALVGLLPLEISTLTSPPGTVPGIRFKNIIEWKSRLWAFSDEPALIDTVFISETNKIYAWPNAVVAYPTGQDTKGIIGFASRRNQLGILKRNGLWQISSSSGSTGVSINNVTVSQIAFGKAGSLSPDSIVTVNDRVYWLGTDGVYEWGDEGVTSISNDTVAPWFKSDTYFNRGRFENAFGKYNELKHQYELHLAAVGSSTEDRWIAFNLINRKWYGPHKTAAFTPSHAANLLDGNGLPVALVGGTNGIVYVANSTAYRDGPVLTPSAIDMNVITPMNFANAPDIDHFWGELSTLTKVEGAGILSIYPTLGRLNSPVGPTIPIDLTRGRQRNRIVGTGAGMKLEFQQADVNQGCTIYGFEVPWFELGRR